MMSRRPQKFMFFERDQNLILVSFLNKASLKKRDNEAPKALSHCGMNYYRYK